MIKNYTIYYLAIESCYKVTDNLDMVKIKEKQSKNKLKQ